MNLLNVECIKDVYAKIPVTLYDKINDLILERVTKDYKGEYQFCLYTEDIRQLTDNKYSFDICHSWLLKLGDELFENCGWDVNKTETRVNNYYFLDVHKKA